MSQSEWIEMVCSILDDSPFALATIPGPIFYKMLLDLKSERTSTDHRWN
jgi:hypothetical protein